MDVVLIRYALRKPAWIYRGSHARIAVILTIAGKSITQILITAIAIFFHGGLNVLNRP